MDEEYLKSIRSKDMTENEDMENFQNSPLNNKSGNSEKQKNYKKRLILGDGNFSYTKSLIEKHVGMNGLSQAIIATEYFSESCLTEEVELDNIFALSKFSPKDIETLKKLVGNEFSKIQNINLKNTYSPDYIEISFCQKEILEIKDKLEKINSDDAKKLSVNLCQEMNKQLEIKEMHEKTKENVAFIRNNGGTVKFEVDATELAKSFHDREKFKRIHFNCPFVNNFPNTITTVSAFFKSAKEMQNSGDRIHMALVDTKDKYHQIKGYDIVEASASSGYELIKKRKFGSERYRDYTHQSTLGNNKSSCSSSAKEFIFKKTEENKKKIIENGKSSNFIRIYSNTFKGYEGNAFEKDTDNDSSSYEDKDTVILRK